jgi:hypothetical protein
VSHDISSIGFSNQNFIKVHKILISPVVLYGCETWSLTLREEHRLRVFENRVLKRIFGLKEGGRGGRLQKLHNEELHNLYASPHIIRVTKTRRMRWAGHITSMREIRNAYNISIGKHQRTRPLGFPRCRWEQSCSSVPPN